MKLIDFEKARELLHHGSPVYQIHEGSHRRIRDFGDLVGTYHSGGILAVWKDPNKHQPWGWLYRVLEAAEGVSVQQGEVSFGKEEARRLWAAWRDTQYVSSDDLVKGIRSDSIFLLGAARMILEQDGHALPPQEREKIIRAINELLSRFVSNLCETCKGVGKEETSTDRGLQVWECPDCDATGLKESVPARQREYDVHFSLSGTFRVGARTPQEAEGKTNEIIGSKIRDLEAVLKTGVADNHGYVFDVVEANSTE